MRQTSKQQFESQRAVLAAAKNELKDAVAQQAGAISALCTEIDRASQRAEAEVEIIRRLVDRLKKCRSPAEPARHGLIRLSVRFFPNSEATPERPVRKWLI